eukprot:1161952-Pelagomonas_calceolata.AAC.6
MSCGSRMCPASLPSPLSPLLLPPFLPLRSPLPPSASSPTDAAAANAAPISLCCNCCCCCCVEPGLLAKGVCHGSRGSKGSTAAQQVGPAPLHPSRRSLGRLRMKQSSAPGSCQHSGTACAERKEEVEGRGIQTHCKSYSCIIS